MSETTLRVCLVTTWNHACGIAEHSKMLKEAVEAADPGIEIVPEPDALDPYHDSVRSLAVDPQHGIDIIHLNYQASLHSRWSAETISSFKARTDLPVLVTYHDTGVPNSDQCKSVVATADAAVVHEPFDDLPPAATHYWRMGVPDLRYGPHHFPPSMEVRPYLGTVGFPFPWKCYDELARVTTEVGWGLYLIAPGSTAEQIDHWKTINPHTVVEPLFIRGDEIPGRLSACDATAFCYVTHNTGQSGAILQGIAARKPVIALRTCRQFRALYDDHLGRFAIRWAETFEDVKWMLTSMPLSRLDVGIVALAEQESWRHLGRKYSHLYRNLATR